MKPPRRWLLAALLWLAAPVSAAVVSPLHVVNGPKALRTLQRYDLPGGGNLPTLLLDAVHDRLALPLDVQIPVALRLFGSSVYLADPQTNAVDWKNVGDVDVVVYVDPEEVRIALKREHPFKTADWIEDRQRGALKGIEEAIAKRLEKIASELGGVKQPHVIVPKEGFAALTSLVGSPAFGYHAYEPHFADGLGIAKVRSVVETLPADRLYSAISMRDASVFREIEDRFWKNMIDAKLVKRFIQRAELLGDGEASAFSRKLLALLGELGTQPLRHKRRQALANYLFKTHWAWQEPDFDSPNRLHRTAEHAELTGANMVVVPR